MNSRGLFKLTALCFMIVHFHTLFIESKAFFRKGECLKGSNKQQSPWSRFYSRTPFKTTVLPSLNAGSKAVK